MLQDCQRSSQGCQDVFFEGCVTYCRSGGPLKAARETLETAGEALTYAVWVDSLPELQSSSGFCSMWSKVRGFIAYNKYMNTISSLSTSYHVL